MIAVTGGAGFIGSVLIWKLNQLGITDILVIDQGAKKSPKWKNIEKHKFADYLESNTFLEKIRKNGFKKGELTALFHMGACTDTTENNKKYLTENNFEYTKLLAEWSLKNAARFLYASSAATYGAGELGYSDSDDVTPKLHPLNPYGESKQQFDLWVLREKLQSKMAGFKFFNVFGPNEYHKGAMRSLLHKGYEQIKKEGKIRLFRSYRPDYKDGEQLRDFIYVKDVADTAIWFWQNPGKNGIYNLGTGVANSWNTLARSIFNALKLPVNIEYIEMPENIRGQYQYCTQADLSKLRAAGYRTPFQNIEDSAADYVLNHLEKANPYL